MEDANPSDPSSARAMGLGGAVLDESLLDELLQKVVVLALHVLGSADSVSITLPAPNGFRTSNTTGEAALRLDEAQYAATTAPAYGRSGRRARCRWISASTAKDGLTSTSGQGSSAWSPCFRRPSPRVRARPSAP